MVTKLETKTHNRRSADYSLLDALKAFESADSSLLAGTCGNIQTQFNPEWKNGAMQGGIFGGESFYEAVSAPFLLAKLVAGYPGLSVNAEGQDAYKITWTVVLKHKSSGNVVTFYDWKGGSSFGGNLTSAKGKFKTDLIALLLALVNQNFPHPYDGCRIGEIA